MSGKLTFAYPGRLDRNTGGYAYDRRVIEGLRRLNWDVHLLPLGEGFPFPDDATKMDAQTQLSALADNSLLLIDGLAYGTLDDWARCESGRLRIMALVHHPLALETGLSLPAQARLRHSELSALAHARHIVVTSPMTARELQENYSVSASAITVALPGTERQPSTPRSDNDPLQILSIGSLIPRKGHDVLLDALSTLKDLSWHATIIGSTDLDPPTALAVRDRIAQGGLASKVTLAGEITDVHAHYRQADMFALASRYEGFGMVFAEALAHGLPIVACKAGAVPDVVPPSAGILVPVDDVAAFSAALHRLLTDREERQEKARGAVEAGALLPDWDKTAQTISDALENCP